MHAFYGGPDKKKAGGLELGRRFIRLITGHNNLNWFQTRIGRSMAVGLVCAVSVMTKMKRLYTGRQSARDFGNHDGTS